MIDLAKILRHAPKGLKLFSPIFGQVKFLTINDAFVEFPVCVYKEDCHNPITFTPQGKYSDCSDGECMLFPAGWYRKWDGWQKVLFCEGDIVTNPIFGTLHYEDTNHGINKFGGWEAWRGGLDGYSYASPDEARQFLDNLGKAGWRKMGKHILPPADSTTSSGTI